MNVLHIYKYKHVYANTWCNTLWYCLLLFWKRCLACLSLYVCVQNTCGNNVRTLRLVEIKDRSNATGCNAGLLYVRYHHASLWTRTTFQNRKRKHQGNRWLWKEERARDVHKNRTATGSVLVFFLHRFRKCKHIRLKRERSGGREEIFR